MSVGADFSQHMEAVARALLGMPNNQLSNGKKLRFGTHGSMSVDIEKGVFHSFEENIGGGVLDLIKRVKGLARTAAVDWMRDELQLPVGEPRRDRRIVADYGYVDESGNLLSQVVRYDPKDFRQRRPDGAGGWVWSVKGVRQVPYKLPELGEALAQDRPVFIVEGEKDVDNLAKLNVPATCNAGGAGKWRDELNEHFRGADLIIVPDRDPQAKNQDGSLRYHPDGRPVFTGQDHAHDVASRLASFARRIRIVEMPAPHKDVSDWIEAGGTADQLWRLVDTAAKAPADYVGPGKAKGGKADPGTAAGKAGSTTVTSLDEVDAGDDAELPPPRRWLLATQFCRTFLSSLVAPGGTGKSAVRMLQLLSLATGRNLTNQHVFHRCRVLVLSLEDDKDEWRRRKAAACIHHKIDRSELKGWFFYAAPKGLKLAEMKGGSRQIGQLEKLLREAIERRKPDLVCLDPFVKLHALEENDNGAMDFVCDLLVQLGIEYDIAVDAPHHTKKGQIAPGDADAGRGGSAQRDAGRLIFTLTPMSEEEAKQFGINERDRHSYVRLDSAKVNLAPKSQQATWFKLVGVPLNNGTPEYPNGDEVQTVEPWTPPSTWADISNAVLNAALTEIEAGISNGQRYSDAPAAVNRAAWIVVKKHCPDKTEKQCREIIRTWVNNGVLCREAYDDPIKRESCTGLRLDPAKRPGQSLPD